MTRGRPAVGARHQPTDDWCRAGRGARCCAWCLVAGLFAASSCGPPGVNLIGDAGSEDDPIDSLPDVPDDRPPYDSAETDAPLPACPIWAAPDETTGPQDGSFEHPFAGVQQALDERGGCDKIVLRTSGFLSPEFYLGIDVEVQPEERLIVEGEPSTSPAVLSGFDLPGMRAWGDGTLVLRHLRVQGGRSDDDGGCLNADLIGLELTDTEWSGCVSRHRGGAVFAYADDVLVDSSAFHDNRADEDGGAIALDGWSDSAPLSLLDCNFRDNAAARGGAVAVLFLTLESTIEASLFSGNRATQAGAALYGGLGGRVIGNRFERNQGAPGGGAVAGTSAASALVAQNVFADNSIEVGDGGGSCGNAAAALTVDSAYLTLRNNIFVRNDAGSPTGCYSPGAGAVELSDGFANVFNNAFVDNRADEGVAQLSATSADLRSNLFVGGEGPVGVFIAGFPPGYPGVAFNDVWRFYGMAFDPLVLLGSGNIEADPWFVSATGDDYRLAAGSVCIDAGEPASEFLDPDGTRNDIGAFGGPGGAWTPLAGGGP